MAIDFFLRRARTASEVTLPRTLAIKHQFRERNACISPSNQASPACVANREERGSRLVHSIGLLRNTDRVRCASELENALNGSLDPLTIAPFSETSLW